MIVQVACNNLFAGSRLTENQYARLSVCNLLHHLTYMLNCTTGAYQATKQIWLALPTTRLRLIVHVPVDLGPVKRIEQFVVARRHLEAS